jgi:hypothetical protein
MGFVYGAVTRCGGRFQGLRLPTSFVTPWRRCSSPCRVPRPRGNNAYTLSRYLGLGCPPFARRYLGDRGCFLFLRVLRCFSFPGFLYRPYVFRPE